MTDQEIFAEALRIRDAMRKKVGVVSQHAFHDWISDLDQIIAGEPTILRMKPEELLKAARAQLDK